MKANAFEAPAPKTSFDCAIRIQVLQFTENCRPGNGCVASRAIIIIMGIRQWRQGDGSFRRLTAGAAAMIEKKDGRTDEGFHAGHRL
jgi:hypothetical protein